MNAIQTSALTKYYGKSRGIVDLDLTVAEGEFFGFIGPNGAGKSTTIRTLLGLISPTSGKGEIFGKDIIKCKEEILSEVGYLPSESVFYDGMRVRDMLKLSADLHKKDCKAESLLLCERLQLDTSRKVEELSFGNRKKVGIVCALQHNPRLLIFDEPTSGLDPLMQREFFSILHERSLAGVTIFLSSHVLSEIQRHCQKAAIIREGHLIANGNVEELARTNAKRVTVHYNGSGGAGVGFSIGRLANVRDVQTSDDNTSFLYSGDVKELVSYLSTLDITDLSIAEPDLEEIFMHYYTDGGEAK